MSIFSPLKQSLTAAVVVAKGGRWGRWGSGVGGVRGVGGLGGVGGVSGKTTKLHLRETKLYLRENEQCQLSLLPAHTHTQHHTNKTHQKCVT